MDVTRKSARKWIDSLSLRVQQGLFAAATYLILLAICLLAISPEQYDLSVGDVAPKTITASKDIVDELTTERRRQAAADAVSPVYYKDDTVSDTVLSDMDAVFSELRRSRAGRADSKRMGRRGRFVYRGGLCAGLRAGHAAVAEQLPAPHADEHRRERF